MTLLQDIMQDLEYLQAKIDYAIKEHPEYTEYLADAKERLEEADSFVYMALMDYEDYNEETTS